MGTTVTTKYDSSSLTVNPSTQHPALVRPSMKRPWDVLYKSARPVVQAPERYEMSAIYNRKCAYLSFENSSHPQLTSAQWSLFRLWQLENEDMEALNVDTIAPWQMVVRQSVR